MGSVTDEKENSLGDLFESNWLLVNSEKDKEPDNLWNSGKDKTSSRIKGEKTKRTRADSPFRFKKPLPPIDYKIPIKKRLIQEPSEMDKLDKHLNRRTCPWNNIMEFDDMMTKRGSIKALAKWDSIFISLSHPTIKRKLKQKNPSRYECS